MSNYFAVRMIMAIFVVKDQAKYIKFLFSSYERIKMYEDFNFVGYALATMHEFSYLM